MTQMPAGPAVPVQGLRWQELRQAILGVEPDLPAVLVVELGSGGFDEGVVVRAEQDAVVEAGRAAAPERSDVVGVAAAGGLVATGEDAATVAGDERGPELAFEEPMQLPDIERDAIAVEDHRDDLAVTGEQAELLG